MASRQFAILSRHWQALMVRAHRSCVHIVRSCGNTQRAVPVDLRKSSDSTKCLGLVSCDIRWQTIGQSPPKRSIAKTVLPEWRPEQVTLRTGSAPNLLLFGSSSLCVSPRRGPHLIIHACHTVFSITSIPCKSV